MFLDEPTVAMDVEARRAFWDDMRRFAAEGRTVLFATHYLDEADHVADRIVVLDHGRIVADGSPAALKATVTERVVRFALPTADAAGDAALAGLPGVLRVERHGASLSLPTADADATVRALVAADVAFRHLEVAGADLDAAFLALTSGRPPTRPRRRPPDPRRTSTLVPNPGDPDARHPPRGRLGAARPRPRSSPTSASRSGARFATGATSCSPSCSR